MALTFILKQASVERTNLADFITKVEQAVPQACPMCRR